MFDWVYQLPVVWMALVIVVATSVVTWAIHALVMALAVGDRLRAFKSISPGLLPPLGIIFGLMVGFIAAQVWGDFQRANEAVNREASALRAVVLLASSFPEQIEERMRALIHRQIEEVAAREWPAMARQQAALVMAPAPLVEALRVALGQVPRDEGQAIAQREMVRSLDDAFDARRQRILISRSTVNWVKWSGLSLDAVLMLFAIAMIHCDNRAGAALAMGVFAMGVAVSALLIAAYARPFTGEISVPPDPLLQVMPEDRAQAIKRPQ